MKKLTVTFGPCSFEVSPTIFLHTKGEWFLQAYHRDSKQQLHFNTQLIKNFYEISDEFMGLNCHKDGEMFTYNGSMCIDM